MKKVNGVETISVKEIEQDIIEEPDEVKQKEKEINENMEMYLES